MISQAKKYGVKRVSLFGSYARGEADEESDVSTALALAALRPDGVRIYPTVIVENTELCDMWCAGTYREHTVADAVETCAAILPLFGMT